jgi:hypothetical protein
MLILREPNDSGSNEQTGTVTPETKLPVVAPEKIQKSEPPAHIKNMEFKVEDFDVEQLPPRTEVKIEKTPEQKEEKIESTQDKEKKEEQKTDDIKPFSKVLKAPGQKKEEKQEEKKTESQPKLGEVKPGQRDYSGYSTEQVTALKQMSNEGFAMATAIIKENRELAKLKDTSYLQHEQAYVLDPGFQEVRNNVSQAQREAEYWKSQLVAMNDGQDLVPITGYDPKTGNFVYGAPVKPSRGVEEEVRTMMQNAYRVQQELTGRLQQYPQQYKNRVQADLAGVEQMRKERFDWVKEPKLLDYSIPIPGQGDVTIRKIRDDMINVFPAYMRSHPAVAIVGDLVASVMIQAAELRTVQSSGQVQETIKEEKTRVEPNSNSRPAKPKEMIHGVKEFTDDLATL